jgi:hypothetical protein
MDWPLKIQGRFVTEVEVNEIRMLLHTYPAWNRSRLSRELCESWNWYRTDGQIKDMACRELLRKLETRTLITLPPRQNYSPRRLPEIAEIEIDQRLVSCQLSEIPPVQIIDVRHCSEQEKAFNYLLKNHHYLSYSRPVGQNMKYLILGKEGQYLGCLLFGAAAWKIEARDQWIGWHPDERERNLGLICNNTRFLILDWVKRCLILPVTYWGHVCVDCPATGSIAMECQSPWLKHLLIPHGMQAPAIRQQTGTGLDRRKGGVVRTAIENSRFRLKIFLFIPYKMIFVAG